MSAHRTCLRWLLWGAAAIAAAGLAGCGDTGPGRAGVASSPAATAPADPGRTATAPAAASGGGGAATGGGAAAGGGVAAGGGTPAGGGGAPSARRPRRRAPQQPPRRTLADGTIHRPAPLPAGTHLPAADGCVTRRLDSLEGGVVTRVAPPRPGLSARVVGGEVRVELDTGQPPDDCRPVLVTLTIINSRGEYEAIGPKFTIERLGPQTIAVPVPRGFSAPPDVVRATLATDRGAGSDTASVLVQP